MGSDNGKMATQLAGVYALVTFMDVFSNSNFILITEFHVQSISSCTQPGL